MVRLMPTPTGLAMVTPYDAGFLAAFKANVPASCRRWDSAARWWLIDPSVANQVADLCSQFYGQRPVIPMVTTQKQIEQRILEVRYIGTTKDRGGDDRSAFGYVDGGWSVLFPERVLMEWFGAIPAQPGEHTTLFGVLGVQRDADSATIKTAYRRLAKQWHPDTNSEPGAAEIFIRINEAYQILNDLLKRQKYVAGLALEASLTASTKRDFVTEHFGYRSPLRCGLIFTEGTERLEIFNVNKILVWEDIVRADGKILVSSWPMKATEPEEQWVEP